MSARGQRSGCFGSLRGGYSEKQKLERVEARRKPSQLMHLPAGSSKAIVTTSPLRPTERRSRRATRPPKRWRSETTGFKRILCTQHCVSVRKAWLSTGQTASCTDWFLRWIPLLGGSGATPLARPHINSISILQDPPIGAQRWAKPAVSMSHRRTVLVRGWALARQPGQETCEGTLTCKAMLGNTAGQDT